jgi:Ferritin-like domain
MSMSKAEDGARILPPQQTEQGTSRRSFLRKASMAGAMGAAGLSGLLTIASPRTLGSSVVHADDGHEEDRDDHDEDQDGLKRRDRNILIAAEIAEALAVTTYANIIDGAPFFSRLATDDQGYLIAARQEEMSHYLLEKSVTGDPSPFRSFFYPPNMFQDAQTTLNVLVTLEDAFIAAYLVGVRNFTTPDLRVTSARIMGIESDHRTLARVLGADVAAQDGGPIEKITGFAGVPESIDPPNNNGYERTLCWTRIRQAVAALTPFVDMNAAQAAGFDISKSYGFTPFTPTLPNPLGDFINFKGC